MHWHTYQFGLQHIYLSNFKASVVVKLSSEIPKGIMILYAKDAQFGWNIFYSKKGQLYRELHENNNMSRLVIRSHPYITKR